MNDLKEQIRAMQDDLLALVDIVNNQHKGGVDFGTGHRLYPAEIHTVQAIGDEPEITVTKLAERLGVSKPTISERINKLAKKGLVRRGEKPEDAKAVILNLTRTGWIAREQHEAHHDKMYDFFMQHYGDDAEAMTRKMAFAFKEMRRLALLFDCSKA